MCTEIGKCLDLGNHLDLGKRLLPNFQRELH